MLKSSYVPTISDVAKLAEVSKATVSYVLHGRKGGNSRISEETQQRVLEAADELGYVPNLSARNLSKRRTERVCLVLPHLGSPVFDAIAKDLQRVADAHGYSVIIVVTDSPKREQYFLKQLRQQLVDGALIVDPHQIQEGDLAPLVKTGIATILFSNHLTPQGFDIVQTEEQEAHTQAIEYLLAKGHRRFAFLAKSSTPAQSERLEYYLTYLRESGVSVDKHLVQENISTRKEAYYATQSLFQLDNPPTAIVTVSDIFAIGALLAAHDAGIQVPDDVAIIGSGNIPESEITRPPLTTIGLESLDFRAIASLLFNRLSGDAPPEGRVHLLSRKLILRDSA